METIEDYPFSNGTITRNIKFTSIPPDFEVVVKKMIPEIRGIDVVNTICTKIINPITFDVVDKFLVSIRLTSESPVMLNKRQHYTDEINTLFNYTYSGYDFIKFYVEEIHCLPQEVKTNYDKFVELFGVAK
jgi:hypothetical protein